ncbi:putative monooxygenase [Mycobacterium xenopi 3993]|nr:putative monooxygenase [Mycobacterium xenopi 3993]
MFITPFHPTRQSPTVALEYDMERVVALDRLGFDEAWFGEHHSGGYELIACPRCSSRRRPSEPNTSGWAPEWSRCPTTIR